MRRFKWFLKNLWARLTYQRREPIDGLMAWELLPYEFDVDWFLDSTIEECLHTPQRFHIIHSRECLVSNNATPALRKLADGDSI